MQALFGNTEQLLKVTNNEKVVLNAILIAIAGNFVMNFFLIPKFGAAVSSVIVTLALKIYLAREVYSRLGIEAFAFDLSILHQGRDR